MSDQRRRELEREARQDPGARLRWLRELVRAGAPEVARPVAVHAKLTERLAQVRAEVQHAIEKLGGDAECPHLELSPVANAVRTALDERWGRGDCGFGYEALARVSPHRSLEVSPVVALAFTGREGGWVAVRIGVAHGMASPGQAFRVLAPWRDSLSEKSLRPRLVAFAGAADAVRLTQEHAASWLELVDARALRT